MKLRQRIITIGMAAMMLGGTVTTASILPSTVITSTVSAAITGQTYTITAPDWLALRSGAGTGYSLLKKIPKGRIVTVTKYNSSGTWGYTYYDGTGGWICLQAYAKKYNPSTISANQKYQITASDWLALRNADSTNGTLLKKIPKGKIVTVTKYNSKKTWGYTTYDGQPGWICLQAYAKPYNSTSTSSTSQTNTSTSTTIEAKIKTQQNAVKTCVEEQAKSGKTEPNNNCEEYVEKVYDEYTNFNKNVGISRQRSDCAYHSATRWRKSDWKTGNTWAKSGDIPIGATVFIDNNEDSGADKCPVHKTYYDHVGIYVGNGNVVHSSGGKAVKHSLTRWGEKNVSWGFIGINPSSYTGNTLLKG